MRHAHEKAARVVRLTHATSIDVGTLFAIAEKFSVFTQPVSWD
jgi:hypothetical protein